VPPVNATPVEITAWANAEMAACARRSALLASIAPRAEHGGGQKNYDMAIERIKAANGGELPSDLCVPLSSHCTLTLWFHTRNCLLLFVTLLHGGCITCMHHC
jgi:hypothetical protein